MRATNTIAVMAAVAGLGVWGCTHAETKQPAATTATAASAQQGQAAPSGPSGQAIAEAIMEQWKRDHPDRDWVAEETSKHTLMAPADNSDLIGEGQGATYGRISRQDVETWDRELKKAVAEGSRVFHSADELGSPIAVSCDMCHPNAANTHPETYPKFQVQMGQVVHLRDMINWCVQHPVRAAPLEPNGAKMRALEAYILAQRKGTPMNYGRR